MKSQFKQSEYTLKETEVNVIIHSTVNFRDRTLIKSLYYAGLRRQEAVDLDVRDIDFQHRVIIVRSGKGGKTRIIPLYDFEFMGDLKHLIGKRSEGPVFAKKAGNKLGIRMVNKIVSQAGERAGIEHPNPNMKHINPHLFRHSIARHLKSKGLMVEAIQKFLGHSSFKTTMDTYGTMGAQELQSHFKKKFNLIEDNTTAISSRIDQP